MLTPETTALLAWFSCYYSAFPEREHIDVDELISLVRLRSQNATREQMAMTVHLCEQLKKPVSEDSINSILAQLHELDLSGKAAALITRYQAGEEINLAYELNNLSSATVRSISQSAPTDYIDQSIDSILGEISNDEGIKFRRLQVLRESIMGLQGGASLAVAGRPDKGKTSLIADILTDFAPQCVEFFGADRPILWLNNEGSGKRIVPRIYQAALGLDLNGITALSNKGELVPAYAKAIGGRADLIRVKDMHGASFAKIEQVIEAMNPCVVIWDMMANFHLGSQAGGGNKADEVEAKWQAAREMAVRHNFISLGTVQISVEGGNMLYPPYSALKDSKTGIQGATDVIIMMGALDNPDAQSLRGLSTPKNKFCPPAKQSYAQTEVIFDGPRCRFNDGSNA